MNEMKLLKWNPENQVHVKGTDKDWTDEKIREVGSKDWVIRI